MTTTNSAADLTQCAGADRWDAHTIARVAWSTIVHPGNEAVGRLIEERGAVGALDAVLDNVARADSLRPSISTADAKRALTRSVTEILHRSEVAGYQIISPAHPMWPHQVDAMGDAAPLLLWTLGDVGLLNSSMVVVSGTRSISARGLHTALDLASGVADQGHTIVAGGEPGIETVAHRAAIAMTGRTVALVATGLDRINTAGVVGRVARIGAVISEVPPGVRVRSRSVRRRNEVLGALGHRTLIVEAGLGSESLIVASSAAQLGRCVGAVPSGGADRRSGGCDYLLAAGIARPVRTVSDAVRW